MARNAETDIAHSILLGIGQRPDVLAMKRTVGTFRAMDNPDRLVRVGTPGEPDIGAVVAVTVTPDMVGKTIGVAVGIEVKTATGQQRKAQQLFELAWTRRGGIYTVARSADDAVALIDNLPGRIASR